MPRRFIAAICGLAGASLGGAALAQDQPPPIIIPLADASPPLLLARDVTLTCAGRPIEALYAEPLPPRLVTPGTPAREPSALVLNFSVNEEGRARSIRPTPTNPPRFVVTDDAQATLAAYRFAPGQARSDCAMTIRQTPHALAEARTDLLAFAYAADRARPGTVARALARKDDDCRDRPRPAVAVYPSPDVGRIPPGGLAWTATRWNVGRDGRTSDVETIASSGDAEIDAEARRAVVATTFQPGSPRRGCINAWTRQGETLPDTPEPEPTGDPLKSCPAELRARVTQGRLTYPTAFRQRGIEGWAIVRYDIASWGETGAVEVLDAQPAAAFGDAARNTIRASRATPGHVAGIRCTDRFIFRLSDEDRQANTD